MVERIAHACATHRRRTFVLWLAAAIALTVVAGRVHPKELSSDRLDGTDVQAAFDLVSAHLPDQGDESAVVVFRSDSDLRSAANEAAIRSVMSQISALPRVADVASPLDDTARFSTDGHIAFASVGFTPTPDGKSYQAIEATAASMKQIADRAPVDVAFGGDVFTEGSMPGTELVGLLAAVVILLLAFGSVIAMGLPIVTAIAGIFVSLTAVTLWSALVNTPDFTGQVAAMIGIGVGIDYALLIVTRHRSALARGASVVDAIDEAMRTAGRSVVFAGFTVMISLLGLLLVRLSFLTGLAWGTATAVAVAVLAAITLLPALLSLAGTRIDKLHVGRRRRPDKQTISARWSEAVSRRPLRSAVIGGGLLVALALPALGMRLAVADAGNDPVGTTTRNAYDWLADGFGPGVNGPLLVVVATPTDAARAQVPSIVQQVSDTPGIAFVEPASQSPDGGIATFTAFPTTSPQSEATEHLVHDLRRDLPDNVHIGGQTAVSIDFSTVLAGRLPWFIGGVLLLSFVLLLLVFRSVLVPLKAVVMNLLSIGAAYGVMVMIFQWGWFAGLFGVDTSAPIEPWAPMMLFAIVFGLSMDYEVFLLSSIREEYDRTGDNRTAVVQGLSSTARVITAAAAIMVCVFGSFVVSDVRALKLIGLGLAVAVFIDATLVRMILVPSTMELLGDRNWWIPRWLDRVLPRLSIEKPRTEVPDPQPELVEVGS
ncbi:MAG TPA: MMPL family transporter [Acidimicrobiales bacterium]|nr:MMPL family transporter [Acidimicrobiales bacterium]